MDIHEIINLREWAQEVETYSFFKGQPKEKQPFYILIHLVIKGKKLLNIQLQSGLQFCSECTHDSGSSKYHYRRPVFQDFILTPIVKKYSKQLNRIAKILY